MLEPLVLDIPNRTEVDEIAKRIASLTVGTQARRSVKISWAVLFGLWDHISLLLGALRGTAASSGSSSA